MSGDHVSLGHGRRSAAEFHDGEYRDILRERRLEVHLEIVEGKLIVAGVSSVRGGGLKPARTRCPT